MHKLVWFYRALVPSDTSVAYQRVKIRHWYLFPAYLGAITGSPLFFSGYWLTALVMAVTWYVVLNTARALWVRNTLKRQNDVHFSVRDIDMLMTASSMAMFVLQYVTMLSYR